MTVHDTPHCAPGDLLDRHMEMLRKRLDLEGFEIDDLPAIADAQEFNIALAELGYDTAMERMAIRKALKELHGRRLGSLCGRSTKVCPDGASPCRVGSASPTMRCDHRLYASRIGPLRRGLGSTGRLVSAPPPPRGRFGSLCPRPCGSDLGSDDASRQSTAASSRSTVRPPSGIALARLLSRFPCDGDADDLDASPRPDLQAIHGADGIRGQDDAAMSACECVDAPPPMCTESEEADQLPPGGARCLSAPQPPPNLSPTCSVAAPAISGAISGMSSGAMAGAPHVGDAAPSAPSVAISPPLPPTCSTAAHPREQYLSPRVRPAGAAAAPHILVLGGSTSPMPVGSVFVPSRGPSCVVRTPRLGARPVMSAVAAAHFGSGAISARSPAVAPQTRVVSRGVPEQEKTGLVRAAGYVPIAMVRRPWVAIGAAPAAHICVVPCRWQPLSKPAAAKGDHVKLCGL